MALGRSFVALGAAKGTEATAAPRAAAEVGRRDSALRFFAGLASLGGAEMAVARELTGVEEACLSDCVYKCSGGAKGKGSEFTARKGCTMMCRDKCLPVPEDEELVLN
mmetsp:Transcript_94077/g.302734  ORF Transcript_94077/g.302734 Transcript_94077/m.302734 type:complete len:108 (+) Transcript_94077:1-324(+)